MRDLKYANFEEIESYIEFRLLKKTLVDNFTKMITDDLVLILLEFDLKRELWLCYNQGRVNYKG